MSKLLEELKNEVRGLVQDDPNNPVIEGELSSAIESGITRLSEIRPQKIIHDFTGDGSTKIFELPDTFEDGFSRILRVQYPYDVTGETLAETISLFRIWLIEVGDGTWKLQLLDFTPASSKILRVSFTAQHAVDNNSTTIKTKADEKAVIYWAAAQCLSIMAAKAIRVGNSLLGSDVVDYQLRSGQYKTLATFYKGESGLESASAMFSSPIVIQNRFGEPYLTH